MATTRTIRDARCGGTAALEERAVSRAAAGLLDTLIPYVLRFAGPGTSTEIRDRLGRTRPWLHFYFCRAGGCGGHAEEGSNGLRAEPWLTDQVQRWLVKAEGAGLVTRVVVPGVQRHLWSLRDE